MSATVRVALAALILGGLVSSGGARAAAVPLDSDAEEDSYGGRRVELSEIVDGGPSEADNEIESYLYKTAKNYYCSVKYFENPEVLLYANKTWTFPKQDVNLTLKFPGPNDDYFENFLITGFRVTLYQDGQDSRGFVNSGGMMQNHISVSFICSDISVLGYQFWVFGVNKSEANGKLYSYEELC